MAEYGHYGGRPGTTRQGIYVCSPSGTFLASINSNSADRVLVMMRRGLAAWRELPVDQRRLAATSAIKPEHRWEDSYPVGGLVLTQCTRDLPTDCDPTSECAEKWNQDQVWFSKSEARLWLPDDPQPGTRHVVPPTIVRRLAQMHLVDSVKGQTNPFRAGQVEGSQMSTKVIERKGAVVKLKIKGATRGEGNSRRRRQPHGVVTRLLGYATYDLNKNAFVEFQLVGLGRRWGATTFNGRRRDTESGPLGYVFQLASPDTRPIAPAFVSSYGATWIERPARR